MRGRIVRSAVAAIVTSTVLLAGAAPASAQHGKAVKIGAAVVGAATGIATGIWCSQECENSPSTAEQFGVAALGALPGALLGGGIGYVISESLAEGVLAPGISVEAGYLWGVDGAEGNSIGFRAAPFLVTSGRLSTALEYARFSHDRTGQGICSLGECPSDPVPVTSEGNWSSISLVERVSLFDHPDQRSQFIFGLGYAWNRGTTNYACGQQGGCDIDFEEDTLHLTTGLGLERRIAGDLWLGVEGRWEPAYGPSAFSLVLGASYR